MRAMALLLLAALNAGSAEPERLLAEGSALRDAMALPEAKARHSMVHRGEPGKSMFNLHSYLVRFEGKFFAMWSSAKVGEGDPDEIVVYATSADGHSWSVPKILADDPDGPEGPLRWIARGFFVEGGRLFGLAALVSTERYGERGRNVVWEDLELRLFEYADGEWTARGLYADECMNNYPPVRVAGEYLMVCRDKNMDLYVALTDSPSRGWRRISIPHRPPLERLDEPSLHIAGDNTLQAVIRDNSRSGYLARSISRDSGKTWSAPVRTNYPDATSKVFVGRLQDGTYYLINNPNQKGRDPLAISFSKDGWVFDRPVAIRKNAPAFRAPGRAKPSGSYQYPHAIEHGGSLWVIYATNKEDIEITEIRLSDLHR